MRMLIACCAITLASCAATEPAVRPERTVTFSVPVPVACVDEVPEIPPSATPDPKSADTAQLAAGAVTDAIQLRRYAQKTRALLIACAKQPEVKP